MEETSLLGLAPIIKTLLVKIFRIPRDLPVCQTRVIRGGHGFIVNRQLAIHPLQDGTLNITPIP